MRSLYLLVPFLSLFLVACNSSKNDSFIQPPFENLNPEFTQFELKNTPANFSLGSGTNINIPENAFVNTLGETVTDSIVIEYREMHTAYDVYKSGIPMTFSSFGKESTFQTAGMFEIKANRNGEMLQLAPGKSINIEFASYQEGDDYNFFGLNQESEKWEFIDYKSSQPNPKKDSLKNLANNIEVPMEVPLNNAFVFSYAGMADVLVSSTLTWSKLEDNNWLKKRAKSYGLDWLDTYDGGYVKYGRYELPSFYLVWENLGKRIPKWVNWNSKAKGYLGTRLKPMSKGIYQLVITREVWNEKTSKYDILKSYVTQVKPIMPIKGLFAFTPEQWANNFDEAKVQVDAYLAAAEKEANAFRNFEISSLGIYNYDKLMQMDEDAFFAEVNFTLSKGITNKVYNLNKVTAFTQDNKTMLEFPENQWQRFTLFPKDTNFRMIAILPNNKVAYSTAADYQALNFDSLKRIENPTFDFILKVSEKEITTDEELRALLGF